MSTGDRDSVRDHFREKASSFDDLYEEERLVQRITRPGLFARRQFAVDLVRAYPGARVLDVGCGSGRVGQHMLMAGASEYVGVDFSEPMLSLAEERLRDYGSQVRLVTGDFITADVGGPFDVVIAVGFFDYIANPGAFIHRMADLCTGSMAASFPTWSWIKGPIRKVRYQVINNCPIYNFSEPQLRGLFEAAGFTRTEVVKQTRSGYLVRADK